MAKQIDNIPLGKLSGVAAMVSVIDHGRGDPAPREEHHSLCRHAAGKPVVPLDEFRAFNAAQ